MPASVEREGRRCRSLNADFHHGLLVMVSLACRRLDAARRPAVGALCCGWFVQTAPQARKPPDQPADGGYRPAGRAGTDRLTQKQPEDFYLRLLTVRGRSCAASGRGRTRPKNVSYSGRNRRNPADPSRFRAPPASAGALRSFATGC